MRSAPTASAKSSRSPAGSASSADSLLIGSDARLEVSGTSRAACMTRWALRALIPVCSRTQFSHSPCGTSFFSFASFRHRPTARMFWYAPRMCSPMRVSIVLSSTASIVKVAFCICFIIFSLSLQNVC